MMKHSRLARTIFAAIFLILFGIFLYLYYPLHTTSKEVDEWADEPTVSVFQLLRRGYVMLDNPADEASSAPAEQAEESAPDSTSEAAAEAEASAEADTQPQEAAAAYPAASAAAALGLPTPPDININDWQYLLVNAANPLDPQDYAPAEIAYLNMTVDELDIQTAFNGNRCPVDMRIAEYLLDFAKGCKDAGLPVFLSSGYRSYADQRYLFDRKVGQGYTEEVAKTIVAYPGTSEHQTGMSCDITDRYRETKDSSLEQTETYKWLCEHCTEYGFIVRYPLNKSGDANSVTGIIYEPWHFRYVGVEAATYMTENDLCLEEFVALYK